MTFLDFSLVSLAADASLPFVRVLIFVALASLVLDELFLAVKSFFNN